MYSKEKLSLRVERLEQQLEKIKSENLGSVKNNLWFKYRSEVHKKFSKINYPVKKLNDLLFWSILISFILILMLAHYTNNFFCYDLDSINIIYSIYFYISFYCCIFQLRIYRQLRKPKNFIKILISFGKFLEQSLTTFIIKFGFPLTLSIVIKILLLNILRSKVIELPPDELKIVTDSIIQGRNLSVIIYIFMFSIILLAYKVSYVRTKSYLQTLNNKWRYYKPVDIFSVFYLMLISFFIIFSFCIEIPAFINALQEDLAENNMLYATTFVSNIVVSSYQYYFILGAFILHSIGLLVSEYFVDKQYIEEHNILPLH